MNRAIVALGLLLGASSSSDVTVAGAAESHACAGMRHEVFVPAGHYTPFFKRADQRALPVAPMCLGTAPVTNSEFLAMSTPRAYTELIGSTSGASFAIFQAALMNAGAQALIRKGMQEIREARNEREVRLIRERIERELAALNSVK